MSSLFFRDISFLKKVSAFATIHHGPGIGPYLPDTKNSLWDRSSQLAMATSSWSWLKLTCGAIMMRSIGYPKLVAKMVVTSN